MYGLSDAPPMPLPPAARPPVVLNALPSSPDGQLWDDENEKVDLRFMTFFTHNRHYKFKTGIECCIYLPFVIIFCFLVVHDKLNDTAFQMVDSIRDQIQGGEFDQGPESGLYTFKSFDSIGEAGEFWSWVKSGDGLSQLWDDEPDSRNYFQYGNKILGGVIRFHQVRVEPTKCRGAKFYPKSNAGLSEEAHLDTFGVNKCYDLYVGADAQKKDSPDPNRCTALRPSRSLDGRTGWVYKKMKPKQDEGYVSGNYVGRSATYPTDEGFSFDINVYDKWDDVLPYIECMENEEWVDEQTRMVMVQFLTWNPATGYILDSEFATEVQSSGRYWPKSHFFAWQVRQNFDWIFALEILTLIYACYFAFQIFLDFFSAWRVHRNKFVGALGGLMSLWSWLDVAQIVLLFTIFAWRVELWRGPEIEFEYDRNQVPAFIETQVKETAASLGTTVADCKVSQNSTAAPNCADWWFQWDLWLRVSSRTTNLLRITEMTSMLALVVFFRIFKYMRLNAHLSILTEALAESAPAFTVLVICLLILSTGFAIMGVAMYGAQVYEFRTIGPAFVSLFLIILGAFEYSELREANRNWTPVFFFLFQVSVWLILLNLVIGIVSAGFDRAKERQEAIVGDFELLELFKSFVGTFKQGATQQIHRGDNSPGGSTQKKSLLNSHYSIHGNRLSKIFRKLAHWVQKNKVRHVTRSQLVKILNDETIKPHKLKNVDQLADALMFIWAHVDDDVLHGVRGDFRTLSPKNEVWWPKDINDDEGIDLFRHTNIDNSLLHSPHGHGSPTPGQGGGGAPLLMPKDQAAPPNTPYNNVPLAIYEENNQVQELVKMLIAQNEVTNRRLDSLLGGRPVGQESPLYSMPPQPPVNTHYNQVHVPPHSPTPNPSPSGEMWTEGHYEAVPFQFGHGQPPQVYEQDNKVGTWATNYQNDIQAHDPSHPAHMLGADHIGVI